MTFFRSKPTRRDVLALAMGAAFLAGLAVGVWKNQDEIEALWQEDRLFSPEIAPQEIEPLIKGWDKAVERSKDWNRS